MSDDGIERTPEGWPIDDGIDGGLRRNGFMYDGLRVDGNSAGNSADPPSGAPPAK